MPERVPAVSAAPAADHRRRRLRTLLLRTAIVLPALAILVGLGSWQLERRTWKQALIATITERLSAPPQALPAPGEWSALDPAELEFRRVTFIATLRPPDAALVYTTGSTFRPDVKGIGYWVFAPAAVAGGTVVINRGFVPQAERARATAPMTGEGGSAVQFTGVLRWPEAGGMFTPKDDPAANLWFVRDHLAMAAGKKWGAVAPFYVELEAPVPPGGLPQPGPVTAQLRNNHLEYAITWFSLAALLVVMFVGWSFQSWRGEGRATEP